VRCSPTDPVFGDTHGAAVERLCYADEVVPNDPSTTALITWPLTIQRSARLLTKSKVMVWQVPFWAMIRVVW